MSIIIKNNKCVDKTDFKWVDTQKKSINKIEKIPKYIRPKLPIYLKSVRNRNTKHYNTNTVLWEHIYFNHILNLKMVNPSH